MHIPEVQVLPEGQIVPQPPQFMGSLETTTQRPLHSN
jgi:hypothetical protein